MAQFAGYKHTKQQHSVAGRLRTGNPPREGKGGQIGQDPGGHMKDAGLYEWHGTSCKGKQRSDPTCVVLEN